MAFIVKSTTERLESTAGLVLAGAIARSCGLDKILPNHKSDNDAVLGMFGLLVQGRSTFEEIDQFRNSTLFQKTFEMRFVPARETLRLYLERCALNPKILDSFRACNTKLLAKTIPTPIVVAGRSYIPVDIDVSTFDNGGSHKEGVGRTYLGTDGFAPIFSYIGTEGYMLDCEIRPGSQHCQKGTPEYLKRNIDTLGKFQLRHPLLFRLDGGNDAIDTIRPLIGKGRFFLIKRNLRREHREEWLECAKSLGTARETRPGKTVYTGTITRSHPKADPEMPDFDIVFEVTERKTDHEGKSFLIPEIEIETWWTNLFESPEDIIALYHDHGTSEQFHSELKTDMGVEKLPSGKLAVNALILTLAMVAFNTLRLIGQSAIALPHLLPVTTVSKRKRLRKVIDDLIRIGCKLVFHGKQFILRIWNGNPWLPVFAELYCQFQKQ